MNLKNLVMNLGNRIVDETEERGALYQDGHGALCDGKEIKLSRFKEINQTIRAIASQELLGKIELMKLLAEIHDDFLYSVAGLKSFEEYIKGYTPVAKTTAYLFVKLGRMLKVGEVTEADIVQIGLSRLRNARDIRKIIQGQDGNSAEKNQKTVKSPLRVVLPTEAEYEYYKEDTKFASYVLSVVFNEHRNLLIDTTDCTAALPSTTSK